MPAAITVRGPVPGDALGVTLMHEHLLIDFRARYRGEPSTDTIRDPLNVRERWRLVQQPAHFEANLVRSDLPAAIAEVEPFAAAGGGTIVDVTTVGLGPDPVGLRVIAEETGVNIIASTGIYVHASHPDWVHESTVNEIARRMIGDLLEADSNGIRRGFIGEIGIDGPTDCEIAVVRAAGVAQRETGAAVGLHVLSGAIHEKRRSIAAVVDAYLASGGDPGRLVLCHQDGSGDDRAHQDEFLRQGITLEYDTFGFETVFSYEGSFIQLPTDTRRIAEVADLWDRGWGGQVVLSQDVCYRMMTREWGGWGIAHILESLAPRFTAAGLGSAEMHRMLVETPRRLLAFATD